MGGATPTADDDLLQYEGREKWYVAPFAADDQPDWWAAELVSRDELVPGAVALLTLDVEVSRERVPLRNAYMAAGQRASVRVVGGVEVELPVATPPPGPLANHDALIAARNDQRSGDIKTVREPVTARARVGVWVEPKAAPGLWAAVPGDPLEVGPFRGTGPDLKPLAGAFAYPTVVVFAAGSGIATARALLTAPPSASPLALHLRKSIVVYYRAESASSLVWRDQFDAWAAEAAAGPGGAPRSGAPTSVRVVASSRDTFADMFDDDDALEYDPAGTAALLLCGGDAEAAAEARAAAAAAEITLVVDGDVDGDAVVHTDTAKVP
jgi:hypothetical protein